MPMQMSQCPSEHCRAAKPRQEVVGPTLAANAGQPSLAVSTRCTYCGCVWKLGTDGRTKTILGRFDDTLGHHGWIPEAGD